MLVIEIQKHDLIYYATVIECNGIRFFDIFLDLSYFFKYPTLNSRYLSKMQNV